MIENVTAWCYNPLNQFIILKMPISREILESKLEDFLNDKISQEEIYSWALQVAVANDLAVLEKEDPLVHRILLDLSNIRGAQSHAVTQDDWAYYLKCLQGQESFKPFRHKRSHMWLVFALGSRIVFAVCLFTLRVYVFLFGLCMFAVNYLLLRDPSIFQNPEKLVAFLAFLDTSSLSGLYGFLSHLVMKPEFPFIMEMVQPQQAILQIPVLHLVYAFLILMPPGFVARNIVFTVSFPLLILGVFYYWYLAWDISARLAFAFMFDRFIACLVLSPMTGIPATIALFLLILKTLQLQKGTEITY